MVLQAQSGARTGRQWRAMSTGIVWVADKPAAVLRQDAYANTTSTQDDQQYASRTPYSTALSYKNKNGLPRGSPMACRMAATQYAMTNIALAAARFGRHDDDVASVQLETKQWTLAQPENANTEREKGNRNRAA